MKKAVVTGGAGFIGSHLLEELTRRDYSILIIDDLSTGNRENIASILKKPNVKLVQGSINDLPLLQKIFKGIDYVFHLAAIATAHTCYDINKIVAASQLVFDCRDVTRNIAADNIIRLGE
jgi:nucleoside-diphosphate-sugar epimerase